MINLLNENECIEMVKDKGIMLEFVIVQTEKICLASAKQNRDAMRLKNE